jgi:inorganic pyrophosphatase
MRRPPKHSLPHLPPFDAKTKALNAVIETPRHSRNRFDCDPQDYLFRLAGVLPDGTAFPQAFGFVPSTPGEDGDPLDVLVLMDEPVFPRCVVPVRLVVEGRRKFRSALRQRS